tara:strand:- start:468 stop:611 length:144 start_codon:yes stop_codon:yes gene_type:complete
MVDAQWQKRVENVIALISSLDKKQKWAKKYWTLVLYQLKEKGKRIHD